MTDGKATKRGMITVAAERRMRPVDFAVFGLLLGIVLFHAFIITVVAASSGIAAILYSTAGDMGWSRFSDPSTYPDTVETLDSLIMLTAIVGLFVFSWRNFPQMLAWKYLPLRWTRGREYYVPASQPVRVFTAIGWTVLLAIVIYAMFRVPLVVVEGSRDAVLFGLGIIGAELSESTIDRLHQIDRAAFLWPSLCALLFRGWAEDRCRRDATPPP